MRFLEKRFLVDEVPLYRDLTAQLLWFLFEKNYWSYWSFKEGPDGFRALIKLKTYAERISKIEDRRENAPVVST